MRLLTESARKPFAIDEGFDRVSPPCGTWRGPVLIVHSNDDVVARPAEQARLRTAYPDADWQEFRGAGHSAYSLDPQRYADVLFEWTAKAAP